MEVGAMEVEGDGTGTGEGGVVAKVIVALAMSLDGFIAGTGDGERQPLGEGGTRLFDWYFDGDTPIRRYQQAGGRGVSVPPFRLSSSSAEVFEGLVDSGGAVVTGRRTYDIAGAWGGNGPLPGLPLFVLTHRVPQRWPRGESSYTFVTDGVESAIEQAKAAAGDRHVSVMGASVPQQCLRAGLLDEIQIHLVPVLLGSGVRLFDHLGAGSVLLETIQVVDSPGVTHLRFRVRR
jgi:dihydrofolate reductase